MKWLLTTSNEVEVRAVRREVEAAGGSLESEDPVPLGEKERVLYAQGPDDLPARLASASSLIKISPSSEMDLY